MTFEDLCRVHLSRDSINWYSHIAEAAEELVQQAKQMSRNGLSPEYFGLYVRSHSKSLLITAANKMRAAEEVVINQNLTGQLIESTSLPLDEEVNNKNEKAIEELWRKFSDRFQPTDKGWFISDVEIEFIEEFLSKFRVHKNSSLKKMMALDYLDAIKNQYPLGDILLISKGDGDPAHFRLGPQDRTAEKVKLELDEWAISGYRVASRGDEKFGLNKDQISEAERIAASGVKSKTGKASDYHYRVVRNKPLLMLHVLSPIENDRLIGLRVPAFGISYPDGLYRTEVKVVVNRVWLKQMQGPADNPDDEEDFDA